MSTTMHDADGNQPDSRTQLLVAAARRFAAQGIAATNLKSIAQEVGVSTPAIYYHFDSKEALAFEAFQWAMSAFSTHVQACTTSTDPALRMAEAVRAHVDFKLRHEDIAGAYSMVLRNRERFTEFTPANAQTLLDLERDYYRFLREIVDAGVATGSFHVAVTAAATFAIISMCELVNSWYGEGTLSPDEVCIQFADYALSILGASEADRRRAATRLACLAVPA